MQIGIVGLGRMGGNIARRLMREGHECVVFDANLDASLALGREGATSSAALQDLVKRLKAPRTIWLMLPAGDVTEKAIAVLSGLMAADDTIVDGGNTFWKDDIARAANLRERGIHYLDVGTSGGVWGLERGYCLMIGGEKAVVERLDPIFRALAPGAGDIPATPHREGATRAPRQGYLHAGPNGAGHFVKMIHNGIEYGLMQAYAEGFDILRHAGDESLPAEEHRLDLNVADIAEVWRRGSVITSWLLDLTAAALAEEGDLASYSGHVADSGEGRWTIMAAIEEAVPADVLVGRALYALPLAPGAHLRRKDPFGDAQGLRRPSGTESVTRAISGIAAVVVMGVSGAGKSTVGKIVAARLDCPFRDADSFHPQANIEKMSRGEPLTDEDRWPWLRAIAAWIAEHRAADTTCVVTCSALKRAYRDIVTNKQRADVRLVYLKGDFDLIAARLKARKGHFMPPELLNSQFDALEEPAPDEHAITVSIDATPEEIAARVMEKLSG